jgi:hypothetical protein
VALPPRGRRCVAEDRDHGEHRRHERLAAPHAAEPAQRRRPGKDAGHEHDDQQHHDHGGERLGAGEVDEVVGRPRAGRQRAGTRSPTCSGNSTTRPAAAGPLQNRLFTGRIRTGATSRSSRGRPGRAHSPIGHSAGPVAEWPMSADARDGSLKT